MSWSNFQTLLCHLTHWLFVIASALWASMEVAKKKLKKMMIQKIGLFFLQSFNQSAEIRKCKCNIQLCSSDALFSRRISNFSLDIPLTRVLINFSIWNKLYLYKYFFLLLNNEVCTVLYFFYLKASLSIKSKANQMWM